ncbi:hypothetical protein LCGC14_2437830, partial [marine sediment metagenome]
MKDKEDFEQIQIKDPSSEDIE